VSSIMAIAGREIRGYFATPVGWVVLCVFLILTGFFFASMISFYNMQAAEMAMSPYGGPELNLNDYLVAPFFANMAVILLFLCPAITMRVFSEDRSTKALELLLTSPVSTAEIVLGKYLGAMGFVGLMLVATLHYPAMLYAFGSPDAGVVLCSYLSVILLSGSFVAVGVLTSAFTESQVVALIAGFGILLMLWVISWADASSSSSTVGEVLSYLSVLSHLEQLAKGLVHTEDLVYYASFIGFFLFATQQRVEAFRWR
jgi:ABC-2 type transport system permease protein